MAGVAPAKPSVKQRSRIATRLSKRAWQGGRVRHGWPRDAEETGHGRLITATRSSLTARPCGLVAARYAGYPYVSVRLFVQTSPDILRPLVWVRIFINVSRSTRRRLTHFASRFTLNRRRFSSQAFRRQHNILSPLVRVRITVANRSCGSQSGRTNFVSYPRIRRWFAFPY